jgi:mono/diheme cytochrome c family protein
MRSLPASSTVAIALGFFAALAPASAQDGSILEQGRLAYQSCVACHGPDGKGVRAGDLLMAPSLHESALVKGGHAELIAAVVLKGIHKEDAKYVQAMLALEAALDDRAIASLIAYLTREFGGERVDAKPAEVARWRRDRTGRTSPYKRSEIAEMLAEASAPPLLTNLRYSLYLGKWEELPDFSSLEPEASGTLPDGLVTLDPARDRKGAFGLLFEADLRIPVTGDYVFSLTSDDGSALVIDGETVVGNDGIHPARTVSMKETLEAGLHTLKLPYFEAGGQRSLALSMRGPGAFGTRWLSVEREAAKKAAQSFDPIPLSARQPGEAVIHRAFLPEAKPRAIGVGYPGAVNLVWDADVLNLAYLYRGDFMDAAPHWNGRGSGSKPLGQDRIKPAHGLPFQILESLDEPWRPFSEAKVKYERDTADPQKEITINVPHPDYRFRGYRLDEKRFPTFRYDYRDLAVEDSFAPAEVEGVVSFVRRLALRGRADENTWFRLAAGGPRALEEGWIDLGGGMKAQIEGAEPAFRQSEGANEALVPIPAGPVELDLTIRYRWNEPLRP